jgi:hypothetical protein
MATRSKSIDVQSLVSGAAKLELKLLNAGVEAMQVVLNEASRFSELADETLRAVQDDKATLADTVQKASAFGRKSLQAYADLAQRLGARYYDELERLTDTAPKPDGKSPSKAPVVAAAKRKRARSAARKG